MTAIYLVLYSTEATRTDQEPCRIILEFKPTPCFHLVDPYTLLENPKFKRKDRILFTNNRHEINR